MGYRYTLLGAPGNVMTFQGDDGDTYVLAVDNFREFSVIALGSKELELARLRGEAKDGST